MYDKTQTSGIFTAAQSGIQSSLQYLLQNNTSGITKTSLNSILSNNTTGVNSSFYQMISSQFSTLDKDNDGTLTSDEANTMLSNLSSGVSKQEISQLVAAGSIDEELASKIIANFSKIDTNGDGRVSEAEINSYFMNEDIQSKKDDQMKLLIKNMSCYYDVDTDDGVSSTDET